jgi:hypothetical protein
MTAAIRGPYWAGALAPAGAGALVRRVLVWAHICSFGMPCRAGGALRGAGVLAIMLRRAPVPCRGLAVGAEPLPGPF